MTTKMFHHLPGREDFIICKCPFVLVGLPCFLWRWKQTITQMMITSAKLPPIIGPIMIPIFVDLDIGDPKNGFPGVYLQGFHKHTLVKFGKLQPFFFLVTKNNGNKFISFKRIYFHKHEKCLWKGGAKYLDLWFLLTWKSKWHCWEWNLGEWCH